MEKVVIFIDGSNFYHGIRDNLGKDANIDFERFGKLLTGERKLVRTYYYNAPVRKEDGEDRYKRQQKFLQKLETLSYFTVKLGRLEKRPKGVVVEKGVDVNIAVDMLHLAYTNVYDTAILVSGDGDFAYAIETVKSLGKHVEVAYFWSKISHPSHLRKAADKFIVLTENYLKKCVFKKRSIPFKVKKAKK